MTPSEISIVISFTALTVSLINLYFHWFRVRGPIITLLNRGEEQRAVLRSYNGLPPAVKQQFPQYKQKYPGYAIVRLVFANSGDKAGYAKVFKVQADNLKPAESEDEQIKVSFYTHILVPAYNLVQQDVVLRNIPPIDTQKEIGLLVNLEWGGSSRRGGEYRKKGAIESRLKVVLQPSGLQENGAS